MKTPDNMFKQALTRGETQIGLWLGEHGLGVLRRDEAARYKSPVELKLMRATKAALDPHNLMNPGKVLSS
jgi:FAD/FMN-containing dehydrogenase